MKEQSSNFKVQSSNDVAAAENSRPLWKPTYKWLAKTGGIILGIVIVLFFVFNIVLSPYMRKMPADVTPWLVSNPSQPVQSWGNFFSSVLPFGGQK